MSKQFFGAGWSDFGLQTVQHKLFSKLVIKTVLRKTLWGASSLYAKYQDRTLGSQTQTVQTEHIFEPRLYSLQLGRTCCSKLEFHFSLYSLLKEMNAQMFLFYKK